MGERGMGWGCSSVAEDLPSMERTCVPSPAPQTHTEKWLMLYQPQNSIVTVGYNDTHVQF
jgi:hypothetical protein